MRKRYSFQGLKYIEYTFEPLTTGDYDGIERTERYRSQTEVMKTLVEARWSTIPTLEELSQPDCVRRLRDQVYLGSYPRFFYENKPPSLLSKSSVHLLLD